MDKQSLNEIKKKYDEDGFVILRNYLSHEQLNTLKEISLFSTTPHEGNLERTYYRPEETDTI